MTVKKRALNRFSQYRTLLSRIRVNIQYLNIGDFIQVYPKLNRIQ